MPFVRPVIVQPAAAAVATQDRLKLTATALPDAVAAADSVKDLPTMAVTVSLAGIPVPLTLMPTEIPLADDTVMVLEPDVNVPVVEVLVLGTTVAVYDKIRVVPKVGAGSQVTATVPSPGVATTLVGAPGIGAI